MSLVSHLECGRCAKQFEPGKVYNHCECGSPLAVRYNLKSLATVDVLDRFAMCASIDGRLPDVMIYPTGGGTGLVDMWKAFDEMQEMGWIERRRPAMNAVQSTGCAPIVRAFAQHAEKAEDWAAPKTSASGLRVPSAIGDFLMLRAMRESRGGALAIEDHAMLEGMRELAETEGIITSPEGGATLAAFRRLLADGFIAGFETVVFFLTGSGYKYVESMEAIVRPPLN